MKRLSFGLLLLSAAAIFLGLKWGVVPLSFTAFFSPTPFESALLLDIRLPRVMTAFLVGASLSVAGAVFQSMLRNPLADPYVLGVSSGAGLGIVVGVVLGIAQFHVLMLPLLAFVGSVATIALVVGIVRSTGVFSITNFVLAGIMMNAFFSAIMLGLLFFSTREAFGVLYWLMGDLSKTSSELLWVSYAFCVPLMMGLYAMSYPLTILSTGEDHALSLGVPVTKLRYLAFVLASCLTGIAVACAGMIGFVGLLVPHLLRLISGDDLRWLIPHSLLLGGSFLVLMDTLSKVIFSPIELPVGILTAVIGVPVFISIMMKRLRI